MKEYAGGGPSVYTGDRIPSDPPSMLTHTATVNNMSFRDLAALAILQGIATIPLYAITPSEIFDKADAMDAERRKRGSV